MRGPVRCQDREVGRPAEPLVERRQLTTRRHVRLPLILQPPLADLAVGAAVDATGGAIRRAQALVIAQVPVVAERELGH
jgi:hypothetical protein